MSVDSPTGPRAVVPVARNRARMPAGRLNCLNVRLADEEMREVSAAARRAGLTPTGYAGEVAVAAARADAQGSAAGATRAELARVQREVFAVRAALVSAARSIAGGCRPTPRVGSAFHLRHEGNRANHPRGALRTGRLPG
ncbi:hypothetical protein GCM10027615_68680 [Plantactinospora veratri]